MRSKTARVEDRLFKADKELGEARASRAWHRGSYLRYRSFIRLYELWEMGVKDPISSDLLCMAGRGRRR